ncbi:hypothetical protein V8G54_031568 [Vigna mungo]|uniref:Protein NRT1/ PTR FAMILY 7.1 n=1 Tax=Vigna mungo TaxID=3915 RepID=A0AAQ3MKB5_VIGMU
MDKAATIKDSEEQSSKNPWRLCTVTQVEEAKCVLRMLPVWLCTIIYSVVFTQMASLFVEQGDVMNSYIGSFHLPAASMSAFDICSVLVCTGIYRQILVPLAGKLSGNPKGLSELQRMGIGLIIGMFAMVASGATEIARLRRIIHGQKTSSLSIFWQIPQYVLVGASEVFMYVGQLEFFNGQAPDGIKSFGSSLCMASISLGNYVSSMLVNMVMIITARGQNKGWIPENLNTGHMDRFFFLLAGLAAFDFVLYLLCAKWYKNINVEDGDMEEQEHDDDVNSKASVCHEFWLKDKDASDSVNCCRRWDERGPMHSRRFIRLDALTVETERSPSLFSKPGGRVPVKGTLTLDVVGMVVSRLRWYQHEQSVGMVQETGRRHEDNDNARMYEVVLAKDMCKNINQDSNHSFTH